MHTTSTDLHPRDVCVDVPEHGALDPGDVVEVPARLGVPPGLLAEGGRVSRHGEATAVFASVEVRTVFHHNLARRESG